MKTLDAARGKWAGILQHFGIDQDFLKNRHGPCPCCGGKDRFRFDDKNGDGTHYCSQCGAGNGFDLAMKITGKPFAEVAKEIDAIVGNIQVGSIPPAIDHTKRVHWILGTLDKMPSINPARLYLKGRRLPYSQLIASHPGVKYYEDGKYLATYPAMVARIIAPTGELVGIHLTHLTQDGKKAPVNNVKKIYNLTDLNGAAIRLTKIYPHIGIAEGIETALAVMKTYRMPCWATGTAGLLEAFEPPEGVEQITVFADNDKSFTGQASAYALAKKLYRKKIHTTVMIPEAIGDFADEVIA